MLSSQLPFIKTSWPKHWTVVVFSFRSVLFVIIVSLLSFIFSIFFVKQNHDFAATLRRLRWICVGHVDLYGEFEWVLRVCFLFPLPLNTSYVMDGFRLTYRSVVHGLGSTLGSVVICASSNLDPDLSSLAVQSDGYPSLSGQCPDQSSLRAGV